MCLDRLLSIEYRWIDFHVLLKIAESPEESPEANVAAVESEANESPADGGETNAEELGAVATADETEREISGFRFSSTPYIRNLPGPSQVVTHPGTSGTNSDGQRQRRRGVSGPPSGRTSYKSRLFLSTFGFISNFSSTYFILLFLVFHYFRFILAFLLLHLRYETWLKLLYFLFITN